MADSFPASEFDEWASSYDGQASQGIGFPFEGYARVLQKIIALSAPRPGGAALDLGIGTGNLAARFAMNGCEVWGIDFSREMLARAAQKIPSARLACQDLRDPLPPDFRQYYQHIVSAYTFHHFPLAEKVTLVSRLLREHLLPGGSLVIGDISFNGARDQSAVSARYAEDWDEEFYWLLDETREAFSAAVIGFTYFRVSFCAGVYCFKNPG